MQYSVPFQRKSRLACLEIKIFLTWPMAVLGLVYKSLIECIWPLKRGFRYSISDWREDRFETSTLCATTGKRISSGETVLKMREQSDCFFLNWSCLHNISSVIESNADRVVPLPRALRHYTIWLGVNHLFEGCDIDGVSRLFSVSEMGHQDGVSVCCSTCLSDVGECLVSKRHLDVNDFRNT